MKSIRSLLAIGALLGMAIPALGQSSVLTIPSARSTGIASSTIAVTNTFQSIWTNTANRAGCTVQNNGTNAMYVYFGAIASATTAKSIKLAVGQSVTCQWGGIVLRDQVSITGTATEVFYAAQQ